MDTIPVSLKVTARTPLWTGGVDKTSNSLQATGILGSIRWWTEAVIRGMDPGYYACDPLNERDRCPQNDQYCHACKIFGATGSQRIFRFLGRGGEETFQGGPLRIKPQGRNRGWFLGSGLSGELQFDFIPLHPSFEEHLILVPILLASKWGAIGARSQHGYGVITLENPPIIDFRQFQAALKKVKASRTRTDGNRSHHPARTSPDLREFFFAKIQFRADSPAWWKTCDGIKKREHYNGFVNDSRMIDWTEYGSVPIYPALKNWVRFNNGGRQIWRLSTNNQDNNRVANFLFGMIRRNERTAARINISCAYPVGREKWEFRIWGWIPTQAPFFNPRTKLTILNNFSNALLGNEENSTPIPWNELLGHQTSNHELRVWREFNSPRDSVYPNQTNFADYIHSLLIEPEGATN